MVSSVSHKVVDRKRSIWRCWGRERGRIEFVEEEVRLSWQREAEGRQSHRSRALARSPRRCACSAWILAARGIWPQGCCRAIVLWAFLSQAVVERVPFEFHCGFVSKTSLALAVVEVVVVCQAYPGSTFPGPGQQVSTVPSQMLAGRFHLGHPSSDRRIPRDPGDFPLSRFPGNLASFLLSWGPIHILVVDPLEYD